MEWWKFGPDIMTSRPNSAGPVSSASKSSNLNDDKTRDESGSRAESHLTATTHSTTHSCSAEEKVRILTRFGIDMDESTPLLDHVQRISVNGR